MPQQPMKRDMGWVGKREKIRARRAPGSAGIVLYAFCTGTVQILQRYCTHLLSTAFVLRCMG